jgi:hypothetical protein
LESFLKNLSNFVTPSQNYQLWFGYDEKMKKKFVRMIAPNTNLFTPILNVEKNANLFTPILNVKKNVKKNELTSKNKRKRNICNVPYPPFSGYYSNTKKTTTFKSNTKKYKF